MAGTYFTLATVKIYLSINDSVDDTVLNTYGANANQNTEDLLLPHAEVIPFAGASITDKIKQITDFEVCEQYKRYIHDYVAADSYMNKRKMLIDEVITSFKATPTGRETWQTYTKPYKSEPLASE